MGFADTLDYCGLADLGMSGYAFAWERGRGKANWVQERLDHAVISNSWKRMFRNARLENINIVCFDHSAILLDPDFNPGAYTEKLFRFENAWLKEEECSNIVANFWGVVEELSFPKQLVDCCMRIKQWGGKKYKQFGKTIDELRSRMQKLKWEHNASEIQKYNVAATQLRRLYHQVEVYWKRDQNSTG